MRWTRKSVIIRLLIYIPLIGFFGWRYWSRTQEAKEVESVDSVVDPKIEAELQQLSDGPASTHTLPDGRKVQVYNVKQDDLKKYIDAKKNPEEEKLSATTGEEATTPSETGKP